VFKRVTDIPSRQLVDHHMATNWWSWIIGDTEPPVDVCPPPDLPTFRARFPEFVSVSDDTVTQAILDAACSIDGSWLGLNECSNCQLAITYLAAHYLALGLMSAQVIAAITAKGATSPVQALAGGQVTSLSFEGMNVGFSAPQFAAGGGGGGGPGEGPYQYEMTPYGQRFLDLLKVNHPAIMVV
jgi:hypothetical protein